MIIVSDRMEGSGEGAMNGSHRKYHTYTVIEWLLIGSIRYVRAGNCSCIVEANRSNWKFLE